MTIRSILDESAAIIGRGLAFSRGLSQVRRDGAGPSWVDASTLRRFWALKETKKSRGWLVGLALVALALVVSLVLA
jgi:hypothetical protein